MNWKENQIYPWYVTNNDLSKCYSQLHTRPAIISKKIKTNDRKSQWIRYLIKILFIYICCLGCGYHVYSIVMLFIQRPTNVIIETEASLKFELPAVSVCVNTIQTLNRNKTLDQIPSVKDILKKYYKPEELMAFSKNLLREKFDSEPEDEVKEGHEDPKPDIFPDDDLMRPMMMPFDRLMMFNARDSDAIIEQLVQIRKPIKDISELGPNYSEIIKKCKVFENQSISCFELSDVKTTINSQYKCFTLFHNNFEKRWNSNKFMIDRNHGEEYNILDLSLSFYSKAIVKQEHQSEMLIMVHPPHENPSPKSSGVLKVYQGMKIESTISKVSIKQLPAPYQSNCINYADIGFQSRKECSDKCKIGLMLNLTKDSIDFKTTVHNESELKWKKDLTLNISMDSLDVCRHKCLRHDCLNEYYHLEKTGDSDMRECKFDNQMSFYSHRKFNEFNINDFKLNSTPPCARIYLKLSTFPMLVYRHVPKIEIVEFVCYVGSITGLWLGVSVLTVECWVSKLCSMKFKFKFK